MSQSRRIEMAIGWTLAVALHPVLAWQVLPPRGRCLIVIGHFSAAYLAVLATLAIVGNLAASAPSY